MYLFVASDVLLSALMEWLCCLWVSSNTIVKGTRSLSCYCVSYKELFGDRMTYADLASCHTTAVALIPFSTAFYVFTYLTSLDTLLDVDFTWYRTFEIFR